MGPTSATMAEPVARGRPTELGWKRGRTGRRCRSVESRHRTGQRQREGERKGEEPILWSLFCMWSVRTFVKLLSHIGKRLQGRLLRLWVERTPQAFVPERRKKGHQRETRAKAGQTK